MMNNTNRKTFREPNGNKYEQGSTLEEKRKTNTNKAQHSKKTKNKKTNGQGSKKASKQSNKN